MKRTFTKYPSSYSEEKRSVSASSNYDYADIYDIDFYDMIGDLRPLKSVYLYADSKEDARHKAEQLAVALGYKPDKVMVQYAYMAQKHLDTYYVSQNADGIEYFVHRK